MGAKTALLMFTDQDVPAALQSASAASHDRVAALVEAVLPGYGMEPVGGNVLGDAVYPDDGIIYATSTGGVDLFCDRRFQIDRPSQLPPHLIDLAAGRRIVLHAMHSVSDWFAFAVWEGGVLTRSLSLSPGGGIVEDIGPRLMFEEPYWAGDHPVTPMPGWPNQDPYRLPFHPLDLGEEVLRALLGFVLEGRSEPGDVEPYDVPVHGFRTVDPTGREQAAREAMAAVVARTRPPRRFRHIDGNLVEIPPTASAD